MKKVKIKNRIAILLIITGIILILANTYIVNEKELIEKNSIDAFFIKQDNLNNKNKNTQNKIKSDRLINYIAILEIPKINLKKGIVSKNSKLNNVNQNIEIIMGDMPTSKNNILVLASHSGSSNIAYFNDINKLKKNDKIILYYKNKAYIYKIVNFYKTKKDYKLHINQNIKGKRIILTTCSNDNKSQLYYVGDLNYINN